MNSPSEIELARAHPSRWVRTVIRVLSIRWVPWALFGLSVLATALVSHLVWRREYFGQDAESQAGSSMVPVCLLAAGGLCMSLLVLGVALSMATTSRRAVALAIDMTETLRTKKAALRASEQRLAMVIEGSSDGIWDWDVTTNEVYFSPRWKSMLGYGDDEIENNFSAWEALLHPDDRERALEVVNRYFVGESPSYQLEHRLRHKDGRYRWILARGVAARDGNGKPLRMAGSHVDLTELKEVEQDLRQANEELQSSQARLEETLTDLRASHGELERTQLELIRAAKLESVGTLAAGVAHEVKNPLQILVMGLDFLDHRLDSADDEIRLSIADMRDAATRADTITKELLRLSADTEFSPTPEDLNVVVERSLRLMKADLASSRVRVVKELSGRLPPVSVDDQKLQQVLINLYRNALHSMAPGGRLTISTAGGRLGQLLPQCGGIGAPPGADDEVVVLSVRDSGCGIPEDILPRIFDPFFTTKEVGSGTGLGLSVVKKIIDLHGGLIRVDNSPRGGLVVSLAFAAAGCAYEPGPVPGSSLTYSI